MREERVRWGWVRDKGRVGCEGVGSWRCGLWVTSGPRGWLKLTVYLERSDSILRRKANKLSAPLEQEAEARKKQPGVRSIFSHPALHTVLEQMRKLFRKGEEKLHYVRTISVSNIRPFITKHCYVRWNKTVGIYKQTMGRVTELQSFFISRQRMTSVHAINHAALKWQISQLKWNYFGAGAEGFLPGQISHSLLQNTPWVTTQTLSH